MNDEVDLKFNFETNLKNKNPDVGKAKKVRQEEDSKDNKDEPFDEEGYDKNGKKVEDKLNKNNENIYSDEFFNKYIMERPSNSNDATQKESVTRSYQPCMNRDLSQENQRVINFLKHKSIRNIKSRNYHKRKIIVSKGVNRLHKHASNKKYSFS